VFKNVTFECEYTASIIASNAIFIDCKFNKSGGWHWNGGFSSKWQFTDSLIVGGTFGSLSKIDYGIKFQRCTFVGMSFPDRSLTDDAGQDNTALFRNEWNAIGDCQFYQCEVPASLLWANGKSIFVDCTVAPESTFASTKSIDINFGVPSDDTVFLEAVRKATKRKGAGLANYVPTSISLSKVKASPHWRFVPSLPDVTEDKP